MFISHILRNHLLQAVFVQRSMILSSATSSSKHACAPALLRFEHPALVIYRGFSRSPSKEESFELPKRSRNPLCCPLYTTYVALWTVADNKAVPSSIIALQQHQIILPDSFYRSTLLYTHKHARLRREGISPYKA